MEVKRS